MLPSDFQFKDSSESEEEKECELLALERDHAEEQLNQLHLASQQLLNEIEALEMQYEIERSCRQNAEVFAAKVTKENNILKRMSKALLPCIYELPVEVLFMVDSEAAAAAADHIVDSDEQHQEQIKDLQEQVEKLLTDKRDLSSLVTDLKSRMESLEMELEESRQDKERMMKTIGRDNRVMKRLSRVSEMVSLEYSEVSEKLELERSLRQEAEVFAHKMLVKQKEASRQSLIILQNAEPGQQLLMALNQVAELNNMLEELKQEHKNEVKQIQDHHEESALKKELSKVKMSWEITKEEKREIENQLTEAQLSIANLQDKVKELQKQINLAENGTNDSQESSTSIVSLPLPPPPPPPPLPPPPLVTTTIVSPLEELRRRRQQQGLIKPNPTNTYIDVKTKAVNEMMERIKNGIVLKPMKKQAEEDSQSSSWSVKDPPVSSKSNAANELKGILDSMKKQKKRKSFYRSSYKIQEVELAGILQRRRRAIDGKPVEKDGTPSAGGQDSNKSDSNPAPWIKDSSNTPVLRRMKQIRENRDSRIRASQNLPWWEWK
ncbi:SHOT1 protein, partial [Polypterus senegalus]|nr:shootin-1 [Polypterus senegalus]MBN3289880.1 SHOT1 protein [Polypterus senegalus]